MSQDNNMLVARIRKNDDLLRNHFKDIKPNDRAYEIRRLLEKAITEEAKEKAYIEELKQKEKQQ
ncbi:hypothetical protein [Virgibacillus salexigens]|uniref:Uncharacterized protein n=1 Tax=Virgibacillus massiliensis TaxID=1462526 RepID=A0A024QHW2_9BACI|nr:hypothetical protein [Virgibacillus massiliensis]CDQ41837.1 hypothetical protein BN990_04214 [Virgibacillus massiliensis]